MSRFAIESAHAGIQLIEQSKPHEAEAFFLAMGLITNTRAIFFALTNRDAKRSQAHRKIIEDWRKRDIPELRRFRRVLVAARDQFTKEFSATPLVVVVTGNVGEPRYEIPLYIPFTPGFEDVLTPKERKWRTILSRTADPLDMRVDLVRECENALDVWRTQIEKIESDILALQAVGA